jgi:hypothetical protein
VGASFFFLSIPFLFLFISFTPFFYFYFLSVSSSFLLLFRPSSPRLSRLWALSPDQLLLRQTDPSWLPFRSLAVVDNDANYRTWFKSVEQVLREVLERAAGRHRGCCQPAWPGAAAARGACRAPQRLNRWRPRRWAAASRCHAWAWWPLPGGSRGDVLAEAAARQAAHDTAKGNASTSDGNSAE